MKIIELNDEEANIYASFVVVVDIDDPYKRSSALLWLMDQYGSMMDEFSSSLKKQLLSIGVHIL